VVVNPLRIAPDVMLELEHNLLLCYTGTTRQSDHIIEDQTARFEQAHKDAVAGLVAQKELAVEMKNAPPQRRLRDFGELLNTAWEAKKRMSTRISNERIEELNDEAGRAGAIGGKVTGAAATCSCTAAMTASTRWPNA
jgi:D-glycero-alpha-D-manno-heptose-7-phosphate kinase